MTCMIDAKKLYESRYPILNHATNVHDWIEPPDFFDDDVPDTLLNYFGYVFDKPLLEECLKP